MTDFFAIVLAIGPYLIGALILGFLLGGSAGWLLNNPHRWLFFVILGLSLLPVGGGGDAVEGSLFRQLVWGGMFLFCAYSALRNEKGIFRIPTRLIPWGVMLLFFFVLASVFWSPYKVVSFKRVVQVAGVLVIGLMVARLSFEGKGLLSQLKIPVSIFILLGLMVAAFSPGFAFDNDHALKAFTSHKNTWGQFSMLACMVFLFDLLRAQKHRQFIGLLLVISIVSLLASRSTTSILSFVLITGTVGVWLLIMRAGVLGRSVVFGLVLLFALALQIYTVREGVLPFEKLVDDIYVLTGKNQTLTGRTYLWQLMTSEIERHPWFGIGYGGFWIGKEGAAGAVIAHLNWGPPSQAHNGYIDVINEIGLIGLVLLLIVLVQHAAKIFRLYRMGGQNDALFHGALLTSILIINYAETSLLRTTHLWWIVFCISLLEVHARVSTLTAQPKPKIFVARNSYTIQRGARL